MDMTGFNEEGRRLSKLGMDITDIDSGAEPAAKSSRGMDLTGFDEPVVNPVDEQEAYRQAEKQRLIDAGQTIKEEPGFLDKFVNALQRFPTNPGDALIAAATKVSDISPEQQYVNSVLSDGKNAVGATADPAIDPTNVVAGSWISAAPKAAQSAAWREGIGLGGNVASYLKNVLVNQAKGAVSPKTIAKAGSLVIPMALTEPLQGAAVDAVEGLTGELPGYIRAPLNLATSIAAGKMFAGAEDALAARIWKGGATAKALATDPSARDAMYRGKVKTFFDTVGMKPNDSVAEEEAVTAIKDDIFDKAANDTIRDASLQGIIDLKNPRGDADPLEFASLRNDLIDSGLSEENAEIAARALFGGDPTTGGIKSGGVEVTDRRITGPLSDANTDPVNTNRSGDKTSPHTKNMTVYTTEDGVTVRDSRAESGNPVFGHKVGEVVKREADGVIINPRTGRPFGASTEELGIPGNRVWEPDERLPKAPEQVEPKANTDGFTVRDSRRNGEDVGVSGIKLHSFPSNVLEPLGDAIKAAARSIGNLAEPLARAMLRPLADETVYGAFNRKFVNRVRALNDLYKGQDVPDEFNAHRQWVTHFGRTEELIRQFQKDVAMPLIEDIRVAGLDMDTVSKFSHAMHVREREAEVARRNKFIEDGGARWTDPMPPETYIATMRGQLGEQKFQALQSIQKQLVALGNFKLELQRRDGLITKAEYDAIKDMGWENYVTLKGRMDADGNIEHTGYGHATNVGTKLNKNMIGSNTAPTDIVTNTLRDIQRTVIEAEKAKIGRAFYKYVRDGKIEGFEFNKVKPEFVFNKDTGLVEKKNHPVWEGKKDKDGIDHEVVRVIDDDGNYVYIRMKDNPSLARALNASSPKQLGSLWRAAATLNRYLSAVMTSFSPEFLMTNPMRDSITAAFNLTSGKDTRKMARRFLVDAVKSMPELWRIYRGQGDSGSEIGKYAQEFLENGGATGFFRLDSFESQQREIERLAKMGDKPGMLKKSLKAISDINSVIENSIRVGGYVNARKAGYTPMEAGELGKELTVNFNRSGEYGPHIGAIWLFVNPGIQGARTIVNVAKNNPKGFSKVAAGVIGFSAAVDGWNRIIGGKDEDGQYFVDKLPEDVRRRNLVFYTGKGNRPITIPIPYVYNVFFRTGTALSSSMYRGAGTEAMHVLGTAVDSLSPWNPSTDIMGTFMPASLKPVYQWNSNENWMGTPIKNNAGYKANRPDSQQYFKSVSPVSRKVTDYLNTASGGDEYLPGSIDINPEMIDHFTNALFAGVGRFIYNTVSSAEGLVSGEGVSPENIPFARRLIGPSPDRYDMSTFYDRQRYLSQVSSSIKNGTAKISDQEKIAARVFKAYDGKIKNLNERIANMSKKDKKELTPKIEKLEALKLEYMKKANKRYDEIMNPKPRPTEKTLLTDEIL